ncbi:MAG: hypothetical protein ACTHLL_00660, partial [Candidatus Nitrosocosmicus sp.]
SGKLPPNYEQLRKTFFRKRYMIMEERAETHRPKFVIGIMLDKMGEVPAIETLEKAGIIHTGYRLESRTKDKKETDNNNNVRSQKESHVTLIKDNFAVFLQPRKQIRLIIKEKGIPLLACASATGGVKEIDGKRLVVDFRTKTLANRAINILRGNNSYQYNCNNNVIQNKVKDEFPENEIIIIPDEINLTKRLLEPLHKFHKLAANILIPFEVAEILGLDNNSNNSRREIGGTSV